MNYLIKENFKLNKYHVVWFDDNLWRTQSFFLIAESEEQVKDWVYRRYNPHLNRDMISVEIKQGNVSFPLVVDN